MTTKLAFNQIDGMAVNVKDFGAVGDGVTDDTAAFNAAIGSGNVSVYVPEGTYIVSESSGSACISLKSNLKISGAGMGVTVIKRADNATTSFERMMYGVGVSNVTVSDLTLDSNGANQNSAYEHHHAFMVTWDGTYGSSDIFLTRVEAKDTIGDTFFFHLKSTNCHMTDCISDNPLRVGANVGFLDGGSIKGCDFRNQKTNGIKTEPNDPGDVARNISIVGNTFSSDWALGSGVGGVTLGSPTTATLNGISIVGNTFIGIDVPVLLSKAAKNITVTGNTMLGCRHVVRALSFTSGLGDIQENILISNNSAYDVTHTGTSDMYTFALYNAKNCTIKDNILVQAAGGAVARFGDFRECNDVTITGNRFIGDGTFTSFTFLDVEYVDISDNFFDTNDATKDVLSFTNNVATDLLNAKINNNIFAGTYRYGMSWSAMDEAGVISEAGNKFLGTYTGERTGATNTKYNYLSDLGAYSVTSGTGAPSGQPLGDRGMYIREDGGTGTTLYIWEGAAWVAK